MSFELTLLEDSLDPWLAIEAEPARRQAVIQFLMMLCEDEGHVAGAVPVPNTQLPAFVAAAPGTGVAIVWVVVDRQRQLAVRYLYDTVSVNASGVERPSPKGSWRAGIGHRKTAEINRPSPREPSSPSFDPIDVGAHVACLVAGQGPSQGTERSLG